MPDVTQLLLRWREGDEAAFSELFPLLYAELRRLAQSYLARENSGHTLQGTALVHEAYVRLLGQANVDWQNRSHFFAVAAQAMRRILVEHARKQNTAKRNAGGKIQLSDMSTLGGVATLGGDYGIYSDLDDALNRLAALDTRRAQVVELRFFGGLSGEEIANHLSVSPATVQRDWLIARSWLYRELNQGATPPHDA
jgi:RNA polymerase sigma-70 factor, ECF subfamily